MTSRKGRMNAVLRREQQLEENIDMSIFRIAQTLTLNGMRERPVVRAMFNIHLYT